MKKLFTGFINFLLIFSLFISCSTESGENEYSPPTTIEKSNFIAQIGTYKVETKISGNVSDGKTTYATLSGSELDYYEVKGLNDSSDIDITVDNVEFTYTFSNAQLYNYMKNYMGSSYYEDGIYFSVQYDDKNSKILCSSTSQKTSISSYSAYVTKLFSSTNVVSENEDGTVIKIKSTDTKTENGITTYTVSDSVATLQLAEGQKIVKELYIKKEPIKKDYYLGDSIDINGMCVILKFNDNTEEDVTNSVILEGFSSEKKIINEIITVKLNYFNIELETSFFINVDVNWDSVIPIDYDDLGKYTVLEDEKYVTFGIYPQSIKAENIYINESKKLNEYYLGNDGYYYKKVENCSPSTNDSYGYFSDETKIEKGETYYFKVEPIKWRILTNSFIDGNGENKGQLLLATLILDNIVFSSANDRTIILENQTTKTIFSGDYEYSNVRAFLNSSSGTGIENDEFSIDWRGLGFYDVAFTDYQKTLINEVTVDNKYWINNVKYGKNTREKVFLLSDTELSTNAYSFKIADTNDTNRKLLASDYPRAKGLTLPYLYKGIGQWSTRTFELYYEKKYGHRRRIMEVNTSGYISSNYANYSSGVVPALCIKN